MKRTRLAVASVSAMALVFVTACDSTTEPSTEMTLQEQALLVNEIIGEAFAGAFEYNQQAPQASAVPYGTFTPAADTVLAASDSLTVNCPVNGEVTFVRAGSVVVDSTVNTITISLDGTRTAAACARIIETADNDPVTFTVTGNPNVQVDAEVVLGWTEGSGGEATFLTGDSSIHVTGAFDWFTDDDREGSCGIELTANTSVDAGTEEVSVSVSGSVCGRTVDYDLEVSDPPAA